MTSIMQRPSREPWATKRLGQVFTGRRLGRLLAALADAQNAETVVDPMAGTGDLLASCWEIGARPRISVAIDIDPTVAADCRRAGEEAGQPVTVVTGSAFSPAVWSPLPSAWDLVITNPPYVRYQAGRATGDVLGFEVPGATDVRRGLRDCISQSFWSPTERADLDRCASSYSGLADLAVPSWLLCASRVAIGGTLALVVPSTWLSRDYAAPVLHVLRRYFETRFVVIDVDRGWFPDALVQTTLVVAKRVADKGTALGAGHHLRIGIPGDASDGRSVVGRWFPESPTPDVDFARQLAAHTSLAAPLPSGLHGGRSDESDWITELRRAPRGGAPTGRVETPSPYQPSPPEALRRELPDGIRSLQSLETAGWEVGQGLRTGANEFFYVTAARETGRFTSLILKGATLQLPSRSVRPALRRQADLPRQGRQVQETDSFVLLLNDLALPEDAAAAVGAKPWTPMTDDLERLTRAAARHRVTAGIRETLLPELTAVRTNTRSGQADPPRTARFWYQLPGLKSRHTPLLLVPRVNTGHPTTFTNPGGKLVIDANFSTLWPARGDALPPLALLALLSSSWTAAFLESIGTVLGGGALKVEATHLRRLLLPLPDVSSSRILEQIGEKIQRGEPGMTLAEVDACVFGIIGAPEAAEAVRALSDRAHRQRAN